MKVDILTVNDNAKNGVEYLKLLHQTCRVREVDFHKFKLKLKNDKERTYFYVDEIDFKRVVEG